MVERVDLEVELPRAQVAARAARRALQSWCGDRVDRGLLMDAELLVSELATNALVHGQGQITLRARLDDDRLLVDVVDDGGGFARGLRRRDFSQICGWGLDIVDDLASRWGVHQGRTHVWFELERAGPRLAEADG